MTGSELTPEGPRVAWRDEPSGIEGEALLVRQHVSDINRVIKMSLNWWTAYGSVLSHLGRPGHGALVLSVFRTRADWSIARIMSGSSHAEYATVRCNGLTDHGYEIWPTDLWDASGNLDQRSNVHYDVVLDAVHDLPQGIIDGSPAARRAGREQLRPLFEQCLGHMSDVTRL